MTKKRLDVLLVEKELADTREKAKRMIMAGTVYSEEQRLDKPGTKYDENISLSIKGETLRYVGRGGLKLEKAIDAFQLNLSEKVMLDCGSSTGGFTDCGLQNGIKHCYAIDVGYNQLAWKLRSDERVTVMERTNFRYVTRDMLTNDLPNFATVDVSFISLRLILPVLATLLEKNSDIIILIKPQFEAGREEVGKKGVVRDATTHKEVLSDILSFAKEESYDLIDLTYSPITGGEGNIEFLAHLGWDQAIEQSQVNLEKIERVVREAHEQLT
ncbi:MAG TPA: TlyA family RNA methyltransferase [Bacillota bacterium]|nr:TlyA family RNA methyltransferase [Bacillota bacterium]